jgi:segregation and condensation protein B
MKKRKKKTGDVAAENAPADEAPAPNAVPVATGDDENEPTLPYFEPPVFDTPEETTQVTADASIPIAASRSDAPEATEVEAALAGQTIEMDGSWERPTLVADLDEVEALAAQSVAAADETAEEAPAVESASRLESILQSVLFASDRPLGLSDLKRLVNERDGKKLTAALEVLVARHQDTGIQLAAVAGGWQFRTHPENGPWVGKLMAGRPARLSRAMLETLSIIAYRQPITRPEMDDIRGVDCGPVLKTLLDRNLIRMIGKKEEAGRPILYGTTPEFLRTFSLRDLGELPTLREFHELGAADLAKVDAQSARPGAEGEAESAPVRMPSPTELPTPDESEEDELLSDLDRASALAATAAKAREPDPSPDSSPDESRT